MPMPLNIGTSRALLGQTDPAAAWLALLQASATYAWDGVQGLSLASWVDVVQGVSAAAGGSGTTLGTLNGRTAAAFNGSGGYVTAAFASSLAQPYDIVIVCRNDGDTSAIRAISDTAAPSPQVAHQFRNTDGFLRLFAGNFITSSFASSAPIVIRSTVNGVSSVLRVNETIVASGNAGTTAFVSLNIASRGGQFIGPIAHNSIYHGASLANAATVAAAAQQYYGIS